MYDGESSLDLQYAMSLVTPKQEVSLYQVGDPVISQTHFILKNQLSS